jgi:hypothetical protein
LLGLDEGLNFLDLVYGLGARCFDLLGGVVLFAKEEHLGLLEFVLVIIVENLRRMGKAH